MATQKEINFVNRATADARALAQVVNAVRSDLHEYQSLGSEATFLVDNPIGDFTRQEIIDLMGAFSSIVTEFDASAGYLFWGMP